MKLICEWCGARFEGRPGNRFERPACRQAAYLARRRELDTVKRLDELAASLVFQLGQLRQGVERRHTGRGQLQKGGRE